MNKLLPILMFTCAAWSQAQDTLSLKGCYGLALENAPRLRDREVLQSGGELKTAIAGTSWLPSLDLNGRMSYQSDVVTITLADPGVPVAFPEVPKDQYGLNLDLTQTLYDGGITRQQKALESARTAAALQQVEVDLHSLKSRVNQLFFAILILQEQRSNLEIHMANLDQRREVVQAAVEEGTLLEEELKVMDVEILKIKQSLVETETRKDSFLEMLGLLCGTTPGDETVLVTPSLEVDQDPEGDRPEYRLFDLQAASMEASRELVARKRMPVLYAFGQTGYGKPGYNMLSGEWDFYYMVGAGLRWKIWDWNSSNRERQVIAGQQQMIENQRAAFAMEMQSAMAGERARIEQFRRSMAYEEEVLNLQQEISVNAAARLEAGTITLTEYLAELSKENLARISMETHRIQMLQATANLLLIQGTL